MEYLHIFKNTNAKFSDPYIEFINEHFDSNKHQFILLGKKNNSQKHPSKNVRDYLGNSLISLVLLNRYMYKSKQIFLHGLFIPHIILLLFIQPWLIKKSYWLIWGEDLYYYKNRKNGIKSSVYELVRKFVIRHLGGLVTHIKGDYELAKSWYGAKGKYFYSFMYPSNLFNDYNLSKIEKDKPMFIQVGNSASSNNEHIEIFEKLAKYKNKDIKIICPLSYGDTEYRRKVIKDGSRIFGEKFLPITEFLPLEEYLELLGKIDIAIFNHKRQQAMGNITTLLGLGKKVYIRDDITTWDFCIQHGLKVYNSNNDFENLFEVIPITEKTNNVERIMKQFSINKLKTDWNTIFKE
ncbi:TDP-N-acetylfucosamine:lipid II N-acetylfucosaminyltransferase [Mesobacillus jeotgali]|uniref:TDP-N-acetylfucosamine:lipid II N-acetylfucosaminyltransferase n=1 Tax=Mesobacillus jeotgali TaxID=129985 RepID=UPI001CFC6A8D|nr:TDP-N-acetylfucosamine:lipid II N-acetylfucosaminyltransferase [Mesobacillus jeotgali]